MNAVLVKIYNDNLRGGAVKRGLRREAAAEAKEDHEARILRYGRNKAFRFAPGVD